MEDPSSRLHGSSQLLTAFRRKPISHPICFYLFIYFIPFLLSDVLWSFCRLSSPSQWTVYAGYLTLNQMMFTSGNLVRQVIGHPDFDPETNNNDIALMKLWTPLQMSSEYKRRGKKHAQQFYNKGFI